MASTKEYRDFILEQLSELDEVSFRAMMGEYILYYRGRMILVDDVDNREFLCRLIRSMWEELPEKKKKQ